MSVKQHRRFDFNATHRVFAIHDEQVGLIPKGIDFSPKHGYTSACLDKAQLRGSLDHSKTAVAGLRDGALVVLYINEDDLLRFVEVGDVAELVDTAREVTSAGPEPSSSRN